MTTTATGKLSLDEFVLEMMHIPSKDLRVEQLHDLFTRLELREELVREHIHFCQDAYARNLLCRTPRFDMLVLCWKPGHQTTIHDHCGSLNVTRVYRGIMTSRMFEVTSRPSPDRTFIRLAAEEKVGFGVSATVDRTGIHQLANTSDEDLVTLHVYAPPLKEITVFYPNSGKFEKVALRYTLEDEFA